MANLDEMSRAIGALQAGMEIAREQHVKLDATLHDMNDKLDLLMPVIKDVAEMKPHVDDYKRLKQRGIGILAGVGLVGGSLGSAITGWLKGHMG